MRSFKWLAILCVLLGILSCSSEKKAENDGKKVIAFYTMQLKPNFTDYVNGVIADYEEQNPDVKVNWIDVPFAAFQQKLMAMARRGETPDVINNNSETALDLYTMDKLVNLKDYLTEEDTSIYFENLMESSCTDKKNDFIYSVPWYLSNPIALYNKKLMDKAGITEEDYPETLDEVNAMSADFKAKTGKYLTMLPLKDQDLMIELLARDGAPIFGENGNFAFNCPAGVEVYKTYSTMFKNRELSSETFISDHRNMIEMFQVGQIGTYYAGAQFIKQLKANSPDLIENLVVKPVPVGKLGKVQIAVQMMSVSADSKYPKEATDFMLFITNGKNQLDFCKRVVILPSVKAAAADPFFTKGGEDVEDQARKVSAESLDVCAVLIPPMPYLHDVSLTLVDTFKAVCDDKMSAEEALKEAEDRCNQIKADYEASL